MELSRRGLFGSLLGLPLLALPVKAEAKIVEDLDSASVEFLKLLHTIELRRLEMDDRTRRMFDEVRSSVGDELAASWFVSMKVEDIDSRYVTVSFPVKFQCAWVKSHYVDQLQDAAFLSFPQTMGYVKVVLRGAEGTVSVSDRNPKGGNEVPRVRARPHWV